MNNNKYTDKQIQEALGDLEFPFQEQDWDVMNARLDEEQKKTTKFFWFRTIEALILFLAVWTIIEFVPFNQGTTIESVEKVKQQRTEQNQSIFTTPQAPTNTAPETNQSATIASQPIAQTPSISTSSQLNPVRIESAKNNSTSKISSTSDINGVKPPVINASTQISNHVNSIPNLQFPSSKDQPIQKTDRLIRAQEMISSPKAINVATPSSKEVIKPQLFNSIAGKFSNLSWENNLTIGLDQLPAQYNPGDPLPKLKKFRAWNLKVYFSPDMNIKANNTNIGLAAGGIIGKELATGLSIGGGISYSSKTFNYSPGELMPTSINRIQLMSIKQHHIEIPLEMEFTIKESVNWRPYVVGGLSSNFVLYTQYDYDLIGSVEKPSNLEHSYPDDTKGLLSGGNFLSNNYYTANIGVGLERQLDNNLHLFIQPTFKYALKGIGPKNEKINTIGLIMGARTTL